jgi:hypothetical protein
MNTTADVGLNSTTVPVDENGQEVDGVVTAFDDRLQLAQAIEKKK